MRHGTDTVEINGSYFYEDGQNCFRGGYYGEYRLFLPALAVIAALVWRGVDKAWDWYWIALSGLIVFALGASVTWRIVIEPQKGIVREQAFLYCKRLLKERLTNFADFKVLFVRYENSEDGTFGVWLQHNSGRKLFIAERKSSRSAEELAWRISCDTGIKLKGNPV